MNLRPNHTVEASLTKLNRKTDTLKSTVEGDALLARLHVPPAEKNNAPSKEDAALIAALDAAGAQWDGHMGKDSIGANLACAMNGSGYVCKDDGNAESEGMPPINVTGDQAKAIIDALKAHHIAGTGSGDQLSFHVSIDACVGWVQSRPHDMLGYLEGYRRAAVALFEFAAESGTSPDYLVFPIAFLWRHHVELALKDIIATGRQLVGDPWGFPPHHRLLDLWSEARLHIVHCGDPDAPELANVEANLQEFEAIDPGADGFRYPLNRGRTGPSMPNSPEHVNLRVLHDAMEAVANFLSAVRTELGVRLDYTM